MLSPSPSACRLLVVKGSCLFPSLLKQRELLVCFYQFFRVGLLWGMKQKIGVTMEAQTKKIPLNCSRDQGVNYCSSQMRRGTWRSLMFTQLYATFALNTSTFFVYKHGEMSVSDADVPARTGSSRVCRVFHGPSKWINKQTHMHWNKRVSHPLLWVCRSEESWQPNTKGRKICALPGRAPSFWQ